MTKYSDLKEKEAELKKARNLLDDICTITTGYKNMTTITGGWTCTSDIASCHVDENVNLSGELKGVMDAAFNKHRETVESRIAEIEVEIESMLK